MPNYLFECLVCQHQPRPRFEDEKAATKHMVVIHDYILGPDGPQPPEPHHERTQHHP